ncbi:PIR Superfamily Protein [Plasmodium ovale wallikeri]|uniref:PIR Superfamily Protein n=1 Tax=Plasmodium ovale wallikeri TaxID=864142 RepID=A0A1A9API9_PLAOA|nr:PIR Superfamily Protein [Plasmodium ovale wallikeri]
MADDYNYDFFENINEYKIYESKVNTTEVSTICVDKCIFDEHDFSEEKIELAQNICKKFKCLYQLITKDEHNMLSNIDNRFEYANYWLNYELEENEKYLHTSSEEFYKKLKEKDQKYEENNLQIKIRNIDKVHLGFMKTLEKLYINYNGLQNIIFVSSQKDKTCAYYSQMCYDEYENAIKDCTDPNSNNFCKALEYYREKYENLCIMNDTMKKCPSSELKTLSKNEKAIRQELDKAAQLLFDILPGYSSDGYTGITAITVIGVILAFTPFGSWLRPRIQRYIRVYKNLQGEIHKRGSHNSERYYTNSNNEKYNIIYNSIE